MDYGVRVFYGESVRREDCQFEDMYEELEWFDGTPSFRDLCDRLSLKFGEAFTLKGRFDVGKNRAHYVMMDLCNQAEWSRYNRVIQGSNVGMAELVLENVENEEPSFDSGTLGDCGVQMQQTMESMDLDGNLTQERVHSPPVGHISNDFDVDEFEQEEEAAEEEMIGDDVSTDSDDSGNEEGGPHAMRAPVEAMPSGGAPAMCTPVRGIPSGVPLEVLHGMQSQGTLATGYPDDGVEYEGWSRVREPQQYVKT